MISVNYTKINCIVIRENKIQLLPHHTSKKMNHKAKYENLEIVMEYVLMNKTLVSILGTTPKNSKYER